jgi:hypothetical protein
LSIDVAHLCFLFQFPNPILKTSTAGSIPDPSADLQHNSINTNSSQLAEAPLLLQNSSKVNINNNNNNTNINKNSNNINKLEPIIKPGTKRTVIQVCKK